MSHPDELVSQLRALAAEYTVDADETHVLLRQHDSEAVVSLPGLVLRAADALEARQQETGEDSALLDWLEEKARSENWGIVLSHDSVRARSGEREWFEVLAIEADYLAAQLGSSASEAGGTLREAIRAARAEAK